MKQGNQQYLEIQLLDAYNTPLNIDEVSKIQFTIDSLTKEYPSDDVTYSNDAFHIWLNQSETFSFPEKISVEARIKFTNDVILGTVIESINVHQSLKKVNI